MTPRWHDSSRLRTSPPPFPFYPPLLPTMARFQHQHHLSSSDDEQGGDEEEEEEEDFPISSPLIVPGSGGQESDCRENHQHHFSIVAALSAALRKSLMMCRLGADEGGLGCHQTAPAAASAMEISWPTEVRHVAHVTFDRFGGFLGLPVELEPEVPRRAPSASASVFGVSPQSMQCSYDNRGNSIPITLLSMQRHLYFEQGLQVEGIFRINAENDQEVFVRNQLNRGIVPPGTDLHCLAGLIKAWFRELPRGVLDSLTPDQVMHCNTEEACCKLVSLLPPTESALLDWAINLMADVVEHEHYNKMNARNIAMVFAPNMTRMADPLTALIHAVQVMNFLKTLIIKTLRDREEASFAARSAKSCCQSPNDKDEAKTYKASEKFSLSTMEQDLACDVDKLAIDKFLLNAKQSLCGGADTLGGFDKKSENEQRYETISSKISPVNYDLEAVKDACKCKFVQGDISLMDRLSFRKGVRKICGHPVFQLGKSGKKSINLVDSDEGRDTWT